MNGETLKIGLLLMQQLMSESLKIDSSCLQTRKKEKEKKGHKIRLWSQLLSVLEVLFLLKNMDIKIKVEF